MINKLLNRYLNILLYYAKDINSESKHIIANLIAIIPFVLINYVIFYLLIGSKWHILIIILAVGEGRLFLAFIMEKNNYEFGKGYPVFARYIGYSIILFGMFTGIFLLLRDANENQSVLNDFNDKNIKTTISKTIDKKMINSGKFSPFNSTVLNLENKYQKVNDN